MVVTTIERADGVTVRRTGDVGLTLTGVRKSEGTDLETFFEVGADISTNELVTLVGSLLTFLNEKFGVKTAHSVIAHYADETGKYQFVNGRKVFAIHWRS